MACIIEVAKTIDRSIEKYLPNREAVMSKNKAEEIANHINSLWGKIAYTTQYKGIGGYSIYIQGIEKVVTREYAKHLKAEKKFKTLDYFLGDAALMEQEQRDYRLEGYNIDEEVNEPDMLEMFHEQKVRDYFYGKSSKRLKKEVFEREAYKFIENNRHTMTTDEIVNKLTCF